MRARRLLLTLAGLLSIVWAARGDPSASGDAQASPQEASAAPPVTVHIATTACGADAAEDAIPLLKSIAIHASERNKYVVHVFMSNGTEFPYIKGHPRRSEFEAAHVDVDFRAVQQQNYSGLFKPCSTNRLYMPEQLPDVDALIFLDSDTLAMTDPAHLWRHLSHFTEQQELAAAREQFQCGNASAWEHYYSTCRERGWYPVGFDDFFAPTGINAGVLLMNLTRLRASGAVAAWERIMQERERELFLGDQDVLNIHYNHSAERLYLLPCRWNLRPDTDELCGWGPERRVHDVPAEALVWERREVEREPHRPGVLHGNRGGIRREFGYAPYANRVREFDFAKRGDEAERLRVGAWPAG